jgi:potassium-transporting ATPase KdpC subunit
MKTTIIAIKVLIFMTLLTGILYPLTMTGVSQLLFPFKANGSLVYKSNTLIGSELIGQKFDSSIYFWSRPSAINYNPLPSSGSNLGPSSLKLKNLASERFTLWLKATDGTGKSDIPAEMIFASASGLDPEISPEAALAQADRVARARSYTIEQKKQMIKKINDLSRNSQYLIFGEPRINVFELNLSIDSIR